MQWGAVNRSDYILCIYFCINLNHIDVIRIKIYSQNGKKTTSYIECKLKQVNIIANW